MKNEELWPIVAARLRAFVGQTWNIQAVATATNSTEQTVGGWLVDTNPPVGERLIRLWHFMRAVGIHSPELDELPADICYLGQLLTASVITLDEVCALLGVRNGQSALKILRGEHPPMRIQYQLNQLRERYAGALHRAETKYPRYNASKPLPIDSSQPAANRSNLAAALSVDHGHFGLTLATLLGAALPLAKYMNSDKVSSKERSDFRGLFGENSDTLFELSNVISSLCSERSRKTER